MDRSIGKSLGGSAAGAQLSPSELRQRRLAAFERHQQPQGDEQQGSIPATTMPDHAHDAQQQQQYHQYPTGSMAGRPPPHIVVPISTVTMNSMDQTTDIDLDDDDVDEDDADGELQAALAMSLGQPTDFYQLQPKQQQQPTEGYHQSSPAPQPPPQQLAHHRTPPSPLIVQPRISLQDTANVTEWWKTSEAANVGLFHQIMWDSQITTENDKHRWVGQGIDIRLSDPNRMDHETTMDHTSTTMMMMSTTSSPISNEKESLLTLIGADHRPWGLQQAHGGPCGVLAAIQAEMLRILLFGQGSHHQDAYHPLEFPIHPQTEASTTQEAFTTTATNFLAPDVIRRGLAMAIAIVLARAAYMPCAAGDQKSGEDTTTDRQSQQQQQQQQQQQPPWDDKRSVQIVLPIQPSDAGLGWSDLEPWDYPSENVSNTNSNNGKSNFLRVYTIAPSDDQSSMSSPKRQKINGSSSSIEPSLSILDDKIIRLAHAVTTFLLHPSIAATSVTTSSGADECPLDSFQRPGGVILMVMSLVFSRGQAIVSQDMDYPTMLTSQFGHCGQELINLLLTGQAVSNVFDNTLTPSGELTCRGIQARPAVGYLSQLESLRYCEVGGYYKSPKFPVWVVGSTSHFTVLFGDASCLKESKSDILLEKCRRAFKAVEGGDENGFIATTSLDKVLKSLDLNVGGDHAVQTLAAALEVSGAGIILWDDFWKATSRLLTGASLESVVHGDSDEGGKNEGGPPTTVLTHEEDRNQTTAERDAAIAQQLAAQWGSVSSEGHAGSVSSEGHASGLPPARPLSPMEVDPSVSDEELARRLQAQWDAEISGPTSTAASAGGSPASSSQWKDTTPIFSDDDNNTQNAVADDVTTLTVFDYSKVSTSSNGSNRGTLDRVEEEEPSKPNFETFGESFRLYHYNGLRGGTLTPFRVTRLTPEEAVGASIALNRGNSNSASHGGGSSGDLEDIVRTKWPSCVINWLGKAPPYVD